MALCHELVRSAGTNSGVRDAVVTADQRLTYSNLAEAVARVGQALAAIGVGPGDKVAVYGWSRPETLIAFLAISQVGGVYLGLNPKYGLRELGDVVGDASPKAIVGFVSSSEGAERNKLTTLSERHSIPLAAPEVSESTSGAGELESALLSLGELGRTGSSSRADQEAPISPDSPVALVYTSGVTGKPKGALLSHRNLLRSAHLTWKYWFGSLTPRMLAQHPINHVGWLVCECLSALTGAGTLVMRERFDPVQTLAAIDRYRLNVWLTLPSVLILCLRRDEIADMDLSCLERVAVAGSASVHALDRLSELTPAVLANSYGLTEAGGGVLTMTKETDSNGVISRSIGRCVSDIGWRLVPVDTEDSGEPLSGGKELWIRDECVFLGYLNDPNATAEALTADGWLRTGDVVEEDSARNLRLVGRLKEMYKSGGYNVYPAEIEGVLGSHSNVEEVCVVGVPDALWDEVGVAVVVPRDARNSWQQELRQFAKEELANYKVPKRIIPMPGSLPRLPNGKVDRRRVRAWAAEPAGAPKGT